MTFFFVFKKTIAPFKRLNIYGSYKVKSCVGVMQGSYEVPNDKIITR